MGCGVSSTNHSYFEKKGEINELKRVLRALNDQQGISEGEELREGLKKVIAVMTMGIDVRELFQEVIMLSYTSDLVAKKMIYLYFQNCSRGNEKLAIMAMNAFLKDCKHADHRIRGLAIRTLSNMRTQTALEFCQQMIPEMLGDKDAYVRRNTVMAALKMYYNAPEFFEEKRFVDKFYDLLKDPSSSVVLAAMSALNEIMSEDGGMAINRKIAIYLLNRFQDFNWYGKTIVAQTISRYEPKSDNELFNIMNLLETCLKFNHCPLLLSVLNCFVLFTLKKPKLFKNVLERSCKIFLNMLFMTEDEQILNTLSHLRLILSDASVCAIVSKEIDRFFLKPFDPDYLIRIKLEILLVLTTKDNLDKVLTEFEEYISEKSPVFLKESLLHLGLLIQKFPRKSGQVLKNILILVKGDGLKEGMLEVITIAAQLLGKKLPKQYVTFVENILMDEKTQEREPVNVMECLASLAHVLEKAPYILEEMVNSLVAGQLGDHLVVDVLIRVAVEMFLQRPGEVISILSKLFSFFMNEFQFEVLLKECGNEQEKKENLLFVFTHVLLQRRVRFYYQALRHSPEKLKATFKKQKEASKKKERAQKNKEMMGDIQKLGMNGLSVVYGKEEEMFTRPLEYFSQFKLKEPKADEDEDEDEDQDEDEDSREEDSEDESGDDERRSLEPRNEFTEISDDSESESEASEDSEDSGESDADSQNDNRDQSDEAEEVLDLEFDDGPVESEDVDFLSITQEPVRAKKPVMAEKNQKIEKNMLEENFDMEEDDFQEKWMNFDHEYEDELSLKISESKQGMFEDEEEIEEVFNQIRVYTLASGRASAGGQINRKEKKAMRSNFTCLPRREAKLF